MVSILDAYRTNSDVTCQLSYICVPLLSASSCGGRVSRQPRMSSGERQRSRS
jgi:hypothetical protein